MELLQNSLSSHENRVRRTMSSFVARGSRNAERLKCLMRWRMGDTGFVSRRKGRFVAEKYFHGNWVTHCFRATKQGSGRRSPLLWGLCDLGGCLTGRNRG
jgi:hypothetical protein